jgi:glycosyltransferase involved in cell wall biosynthesis
VHSAPKKKIGLYLESIPFGGGMFQYNQTLIDALLQLPRDRYEVVAAYRNEHWENYLKGVAITQVKVRASSKAGLLVRKAWRTAHLPTDAWRSLSRYLLPEVQDLIAQRADAWIFPTQDSLAYQSKHYEAIGTVHDIMHRYEGSFPEVSANGQYRLREELLSNIARYAKAVLVDSEYGKKQLMESYHTPPDRIYPLPYIAPKYIHHYVPRPDFEKRYTLPARFIFYPAQFWMHKNHLRLVRAVHEVKKEFPDIALVLVGSKNNAFAEVERTVAELGLQKQVFFMGYVPDEDMPEFYKRARALVMPTFFGPTNIPPLEAFQLGCPVAISGIYGMPEQAGDAALLFDPKSVPEMAAAIGRLWRDDALCRMLAEKGRQRATTWQQAHFTERFRRIIQEVVG